MSKLSKMEFLTDSLKNVVSELNEDQFEEVDIIESIININSSSKEKTLEKIFSYLKKYGSDNRGMLIFSCVDLASLTRPKERETSSSSCYRNTI